MAASKVELSMKPRNCINRQQCNEWSDNRVDMRNEGNVDRGLIVGLKVTQEPVSCPTGLWEVGVGSSGWKSGLLVFFHHHNQNGICFKRGNIGVFDWVITMQDRPVWLAFSCHNFRMCLSS